MVGVFGVAFGVNTLEGRGRGVVVAGLGRAAAAACAGAGRRGGGAGCETIRVILDSLMKRPCNGGQLKYRSPRTEPSFLPEAVESSIPTKVPSETWIGPIYLTTPCCSPVVSTVWPSLRISDISSRICPRPMLGTSHRVGGRNASLWKVGQTTTPTS